MVSCPQPQAQQTLEGTLAAQNQELGWSWGRQEVAGTPVALVSGIHGEGTLGFGHWAGCEWVSESQNEGAWEREVNIGQGEVFTLPHMF